MDEKGGLEERARKVAKTASLLVVKDCTYKYIIASVSYGT